MGNNEITLVTIGKIYEIDKIPDQFDYNIIKTLKSKLIIDEKYKDGLLTIRENDYIDIIYHMHKQEKKKLVSIPRVNNPEKKQKGIFATRGRYSINQLGITTVKVLEVNDNELIVKGLDAFSNSPIIDIKRNAPEYKPE